LQKDLEFSRQKCGAGDFLKFLVRKGEKQLKNDQKYAFFSKFA